MLPGVVHDVPEADPAPDPQLYRHPQVDQGDTRL